MKVKRGWSRSVESMIVAILSNGAFRHGTVRYGSLLGGGFHWVQYLVPGSFFSTTSVEVPNKPYLYQNVTCVNPDWPEKIVTACIIELATQDTTDPHGLNNHSQRRIKRNCFEWAHLFCFVGCWGSTDVPLVDSQGADPARAWWSDAEWKRFFKSHGSKGGTTITTIRHVNNPTHSEAVLNCSGNTNRAKPSRAESYHTVEKRHHFLGLVCKYITYSHQKKVYLKIV